jgi:tyrosinase
MEVNDSDASKGVYLCWAPVEASVALTHPSQSDSTVTLSSSGAVALMFQSGSVPPKDRFAPADALEVTLPSSGAPVIVSIAAKWTPAHRASELAGDIHLVVRSRDNTIAEFPVTVRVRKNAETLTTDERDRLLKALGTLERMGWFDRYAAIHHAAGSLVHSGTMSRSVFLAWHRALLLDLERRLQELDPSVALPYWDFTAAAPRLFSADFLGSVSEGTSVVSFAATNPLNGFRVNLGFDTSSFEAHGPLRRNPTDRLASGGAIPGEILEATLSAISSAPNYAVANELIQNNFHTAVHTVVGYYMAVTDTAAVDPLFFLLHANVDRQWALWQQASGARQNPGTDTGYSPRGKFADDCCQPRTAFADEPLWPWNNSSALQDPHSDAGGDPPDSSLRLPFPRTPGHGPAGMEPLVKEMVDYLDTGGQTRSLGYCYDDIGF